MNRNTVRTMLGTLVLLGGLSGGLPLGATVSLSPGSWYTAQTYNGATGFEVAQYFTISHSGSADNYFVTVSGGKSGDPLNRRVSDNQGTGMGYYLYANASGTTSLKDLASGATAGEVLSGHFAAGNATATLNYRFVAPAGLYPPMGYFSDSLTVSLYTGTLKNYTLVSSLTIQVAIQVQYEMSLSVVPSGAAFNSALTQLTFDFGILTAGTTRSGDILVRSNVAYKVSLNSYNRGVLRRSDQWQATTIPYSCTVNGVAVDLTGSKAAVIGQGLTLSPEGTRYSVSFTIGDFWDVTTGTFSDTVQVTVSSL